MQLLLYNTAFENVLFSLQLRRTLREGCGSSFGLWVVFSFSFSPFVRALFAFCNFFASLLFSFVVEEGEAGRREGPKRWWWRAGADNNATTTQAGV